MKVAVFLSCTLFSLPGSALSCPRYQAPPGNALYSRLRLAVLWRSLSVFAATAWRSRGGASGAVRSQAEPGNEVVVI